MNFGKILDEWDRRSPNTERYIPNKDEEMAAQNETNAERRRRLLKKAPDDIIDLHNYNQADAWTALDNFFNNGKTMGYEKLHIIHGKGNHDESKGVLKELTRKYIELCPFAGESGFNAGAAGGSGVTWALIKNRQDLSKVPL